MFKVGDRVFCKEERKLGYVQKVAEEGKYPVWVLFDEDIFVTCYSAEGVSFKGFKKTLIVV